MLREVILLLPDSIARCSANVALALVGLGLALWLCGARYSRAIFCLAAVAAGCVLGMRLPAWRGWEIDGMSLAIGGAIALGTIAFLMHRTLIGVVLAAILTLWAGLGIWVTQAADGHWDLSKLHWDGDAVQYAHQAWEGLPPSISSTFPAACFAALSMGILLAVFLPKVTRVLSHSMLGTTLVVIMGGVAMSATAPKALEKAAISPATQGVILIGFVVLGAIIQWMITPAVHPLPRKNQKEAVRN